MNHIVVDDEAARTIAESSEGVEIRDRSGRPLGYVAPLVSEEEIAIALKRRDSDEPRYTTAEVKVYLRSLEQQ
ncbi:MAG: hypothetical protein KY475_23925 [Planctomycetes bacterium]|nr:hypothetical protein [Planctomycetota bacterium]